MHYCRFVALTRFESLPDSLEGAVGMYVDGGCASIDPASNNVTICIYYEKLFLTYDFTCMI